MVFINDKKFACEACIKGHRSSSCGHSDRPLYEIKKKGRPVSQCMNCREARSKKKVHSKCTCAEVKPARAEKAFGMKQKRYMPLEPTLPNGLADAMAQRRPSENDTPANPRQRVDSLLNPCSCPDVWTCTCDKRPSASASTSAIHSASSAGSSGLDALAQAAAELFGIDQDGRALEQAPVQSPETQAEPRPRKHCCSPRGSPAPAKRAKTHSSPTPGPDLPPLLFSSATLPDFPTTSEMPSFSKLETIAGSGCSCGVNCSCPGCAEHDRSDSSAERCGDSCGNCVDPSTGVLPGDAASAGESSVSRSAVFERLFFKNAALLPPPPIPGGRPVELPKLCCGGSCGCGGECGCGSACGGCCAEKEDKEVEAFSPPPPVLAKKSCCSS